MDMNIDLKGIGLRIRAERERIGLTREKFAEAVGISTLYVGQIERGQRAMSLKTFVRIACSLHADAEYLIHGDKPKENTDKNGIENLLQKCSPREIKLAEEMLKLLLTYVK